MIKFDVAVSLDGFVAGPDQSPDDPIGVGGMQLHEWMFATKAFRETHGESGGEAETDDDRVAAENLAGVGAFVMGRKMFGGGDGEWDLEWEGWWGPEPPYHAPVFVLTHHPREPLVMGETTFTFVTEGFDAALAAASAAAGDTHVSIAGGASTINQALAAGVVEEFQLHVSPMLLGSGERLFAGVSPRSFEVVRTVGSPLVTHVKYRRVEDNCRV